MGPAIQEATDGPIGATVIAAGLAVFGLVAAQVTTVPALVLEPTLAVSPGEASIVSRASLLILNFLGFALAGGIYLVVTDRGWSFVDVRPPRSRDWTYVAIGSAVSLLVYAFASVLILLFELPAAESMVLEYVGDDQAMILVMIAIVFLFNAPAEEFLFRNIIQKRLYAAFSRLQAVFVASVIFALVHGPVYAVYAGSLVAVAVPLLIVFVGSIIFGWTYAKTDNLLVPTLAHAVYNATQFGLLYLALEFDADLGPVTSVIDVSVTVIGTLG